MDKLKQAISGILDSLIDYDRQPDGTFSYEIYADYRDEMNDKTAIRILRAEDPMQAFWEQLDEWYMDYRWTLEDELENTVMDKLLTGPYADGIPGEDYERIHDVIQDLAWFKLPVDHFLKQSFRVDIMVDTGDGNYDYTLNSAYRCWYGTCGAPIDPKAAAMRFPI